MFFVATLPLLALSRNLSNRQSFIFSIVMIVLIIFFMIIFDVDKKSVDNFVKQIKSLYKNGKTIIIVSHIDNINKLINFDPIYEIENGKLVAI
ncbi:MAG: hypothetical protein ACK5NF_05825 [Bacilli bacterium]